MIPIVIPTGPIADAVSYIQVRIGSPSILLIMHAAPKNSSKYRTKIAVALRTVSAGILLPNIVASSWCLNTDMADSERIANVVVFIPPAVDPGDPPISISMIVRISPAPLSVFWSAVLNPAVLVVTDWNRDYRILSLRGRPMNSAQKK